MAPGTKNAGSLRVRSSPFSSTKDHATWPSPLIVSPFAIPWRRMLKGGLLSGPTKSERWEEMEMLAPESQITGKRLACGRCWWVSCGAVIAARRASEKVRKAVGLEGGFGTRNGGE